jgi:hypothetical protein
MPTAVGIHQLELREGADREEFEGVMTDVVFPVAAETPGSVTRGGRSTIRSQHLLRAEANGSYLWMVKSTSAFSPTSFERVFRRMVEEARATIGPYADDGASDLMVVDAAFDAGPRDVMGRTTGESQHGEFI